MKYITNNDIVLKLNIDKRYIINYDKVKTITFQFHTNNKDNAILKDIIDVNMFNYITLTWNELMLMEEGNLQYTYTIQLLDGTVYEDTVKTDYYICTQISNSTENNKVILSNFYTKDEIDDKLNDIQFGGVDLSDYAKINHTHNEYITETELNNKGYLTQHQSLEGYAKLTDIPTDYITSIPSEYITETELNGVIGDINNILDLINGEVI
jgi:hypothetical protein